MDPIKLIYYFYIFNKATKSNFLNLKETEILFLFIDFEQLKYLNGKNGL